MNERAKSEVDKAGATACGSTIETWNMPVREACVVIDVVRRDDDIDANMRD